MKAEIDINGVMSVFPETELEAFALNSWCTQSFTRSGRMKPNKLMIVLNTKESYPNVFMGVSQPQVPGTSAVTTLIAPVSLELTAAPSK